MISLKKKKYMIIVEEDSRELFTRILKDNRLEAKEADNGSDNNSLMIVTVNTNYSNIWEIYRRMYDHSITVYELGLFKRIRRVI